MKLGDLAFFLFGDRRKVWDAARRSADKARKTEITLPKEKKAN